MRAGIQSKLVAKVFLGIFPLLVLGVWLGADQEIISSPCLNRTTGSAWSYSCGGCYRCGCGSSGSYCRTIWSGTGSRTVRIECLPFRYTLFISQGCRSVKPIRFSINKLPATVVIDGRSYRIDRIPYNLSFQYNWVYGVCRSCGSCPPCPPPPPPPKKP